MMDKKVTIYRRGMFGEVIKFEAYLGFIVQREYAQYKNAVELVCKIKRKQKRTRFIESYNPYLVVVSGWNNPDPEDWLKPVSSDNGVTVKASRYASFDKRMATDFDEMLEVDSDKFGEILYDYRFTKGYCPYSGFGSVA